MEKQQDNFCIGHHVHNDNFSLALKFLSYFKILNMQYSEPYPCQGLSIYVWTTLFEMEILYHER